MRALTIVLFALLCVISLSSAAPSPKRKCGTGSVTSQRQGLGKSRFGGGRRGLGRTVRIRRGRFGKGRKYPRGCRFVRRNGRRFVLVPRRRVVRGGGVVAPAVSAPGPAPGPEPESVPVAPVAASGGEPIVQSGASEVSESVSNTETVSTSETVSNTETVSNSETSNTETFTVDEKTEEVAPPEGAVIEEANTATETAESSTVETTETEYEAYAVESEAGAPAE